MKSREKSREASYLKDRIKEGYIVMFHYKDWYMKLGGEFHVEDAYTHEETRYIALKDNEHVGTCSGNGEAVAGFSKNFKKQIEDSKSRQVLLYKNLPEDIKKFFNKEILRGENDEGYHKRRTATI